MSEAVVVIARMHPQPGQAPAMIAAVEPVLQAIHEEPGCEYYALHTAENGDVVIIEKWSTLADFDAHRSGSPATLAVRTARAPFEAAPVTMELLAPAPGGHPDRGAL